MLFHPQNNVEFEAHHSIPKYLHCFAVDKAQAEFRAASSPGAEKGGVWEDQLLNSTILLDSSRKESEKQSQLDNEMKMIDR